MPKTETLFGTAALNGDTLTTAVESVTQAMLSLNNRAVIENREVLWDTLNLQVETESEEFISGQHIVSYSQITASAFATKRGSAA